MHNKSFRIGTVFDIALQVHYSWIFVFFLLAWTLSTNIFPHYYPDFSKAVYWGIGSFSAFLLFVSVFFHELSHSLVAKANNINVKSITLFFFGGVASIDEKNMQPVKEMLIAIAGPVFSIAAAFVFYFILISSTNQVVSAISFYLSRINIILAFFNMVPAFPLDGGRVLRAFLWGWTDNLKKATRMAASGGKGFAIFLIITGVWNIITLNFGGLWFVFLGVFLYMVAQASYEQMLVKEKLKNLKVKNMMQRKFQTASLNDSMYKLMKVAVKTHSSLFFVKKKSEFNGIVNLNEIKGNVNFKKIKVKDVLHKKISMLDGNAFVYDSIKMIMDSKYNLIPVIDKKRMVGVIDRSRLLNFLALQTKE